MSALDLERLVRHRAPGPEPAAAQRRATLPPGQRLLDRFPRFGTHLDRPAPPVPLEPTLGIRGAGVEPFELALTAMASLPRRVVRADFHCVTGWSAADLRWEGVAFHAFYREMILPALPLGTAVTHVSFCGLDGYRSVATIEDALAEDVLLADRLDGQLLDADHGAPLRLVSPDQYGYVSTKHLCRIELHETEPAGEDGLTDRLLRSHPRARVWKEERHGDLPGWFVRPFYRALQAPLLAICARGGIHESKLTARVPTKDHERHHWRISAIAPDFVVADVWALPVLGRGEEFPRLIELFARLDPADSVSLPSRLLWRLRHDLGDRLDLDPAVPLPIPGTEQRSLNERLPEDLRGTVDEAALPMTPFTPLYRTENEFAAETSNRTVHAVMHLGWVHRGGGLWQGQMAVYVKPRGPLGAAYMAFIKPFRYWVVYPALMRYVERAWGATPPPPTADRPLRVAN